MTNTRTPYSATDTMKRIAVQISGRWTQANGEELFSGPWFMHELALPAGILRMATQDDESELKVHVLTDRGVLRYTMDLSQVPFSVALAAVSAAVDQMCGIRR